MHKSGFSAAVSEPTDTKSHSPKHTGAFQTKALKDIWKTEFNLAWSRFPSGQQFFLISLFPSIYNNVEGVKPHEPLFGPIGWPSSRVGGGGGGVLLEVSSHWGLFPGRCRSLLALEGSVAFLFDCAMHFETPLGGI